MDSNDPDIHVLGECRQQKNTPSMHHPQRWNVTISVAGLKKWSHSQKCHQKKVSLDFDSVWMFPAQLEKACWEQAELIRVFLCYLLINDFEKCSCVFAHDQHKSALVCQAISFCICILLKLIWYLVLNCLSDLWICAVKVKDEPR